VKIAAERLAALLESVPPATVRAALPEPLRIADQALRLARLDLVTTLRTMALDSLARWPAQVEQSAATAAAADAWFQHAIALIAWLDGQTDRTPPLLESASAPAIASPSSADPAPEKQPSSVT
jgi:hypothetical protein